ncbi:phenazine biosynthesis FMN-dependent oxidase PhzG [Sinosporangium siamense]|uniref:Pyridoxamine 5'-phosphate oxidase n=1 Tax=Sinosporangium siamense TaxID=1367973 RepID=A0A919V7V1_9ACTN|nr:phenazine biosynthesis FMN-dependent oxidase PhzG [Sinosporangium siamense]GII95505.1 pyridoxamine 5'-phosphate oxidase [Sinosporangium siamense]
MASSSKYETLTGETDLDFPEYDSPPPEPMDLAGRWLAEATRHEVREPRSLALATADTAGRASNRFVTVTEIGRRGLVFTTHLCSRKGRELTETGWSSGVFYWRELSRQVILTGPTTPLGAAECDALWAARAVPLHAMSAASRQSEPLADVPALREAADRLAETGRPLPRPERFVGFLLAPETVEFWAADSDRLHRRLLYSRAGEGWQSTRLQP